EVAEGGTEEWFVDPEKLGLDPAPLEAVAGGTPEDNAAVVRSILDGEAGPARDIALLNAGATIFVGGGASDIQEGIGRAAEAVETGAGKVLLAKLVEATTGAAAAAG